MSGSPTFSPVSPPGFFFLLKTVLEGIYEWLIETTKEHIRFGRERYPILPRTTFYLLTVSIAVLVFLLAIISAFPADEVVRRHTPQAPGGGNSRDDDDVHDNVHNCDGGTPENDQSLLSYGMDYINISLTIFCSNDACVEVAEGGHDTEDEKYFGWRGGCTIPSRHWVRYYYLEQPVDRRRPHSG